MSRPIDPVATACAELEADLVLLHYGDLDEATSERLLSHTVGCAACSGYLKELATILPRTVKDDTPPPEFWMDYGRELRQKIDASTENKSWWQNITAVFTPRYLSVFAAAAVVVLALTFTLGGGLQSSKREVAVDEFSEALPVAENLEFFRAMDVLDNMELLEVMGKPGNDAV